jgi:hypothetical protein
MSVPQPKESIAKKRSCEPDFHQDGDILFFKFNV